MLRGLTLLQSHAAAARRSLLRLGRCPALRFESRWAGTVNASCPRAPTEGDAAPRGVALAGFGLAVAVGWQASRWSNCDDRGAPRDVRLYTYNVLSPPLCRNSFYPLCSPEDCDPNNRWAKVVKRVEAAASSGAIIALQEVDLGWAGKLHAYFAEHDYCAVFGQYGSQFSGYMGVMLAWPRSRYEALDVEIQRISDTAPRALWPKRRSPGDGHGPSHFGTLTRSELREVLGCSPPDFAGHFDEWQVARDRANEAVFVRLRGRGAAEDSPPFCVSTYHMPCLFGSAPKVRVMNIHIHLLLSHLRRFSGGDPAILMGDFNIKPHDSAYSFTASGGDLSIADSSPEEFRGLKERLPGGGALPAGLQSAYRTFHGHEPPFTNFAQSRGQSQPFCETLDYIWFTRGQFQVTECPALPPPGGPGAGGGPFPNGAEPSDHVPVRATLRPAAAA